MERDRWRAASTVGDATGKGKATASEGIGEDALAGMDQSEVKKLRERWELASVLNFLSVFEPVVGGDLKITSEEIEAGLLQPNNVLARLHITLLKGIPPVNKNLKDPDGWITVLSKKLAMWWPWVAEGEIPLRSSKGEEKCKYKELDSIHRLVILKALCEIRANQNDAVSFVNDSLKRGTQISYFRKDRIAEDGKGTSYWYDANTIMGYRLYREVTKSESKTRSKGKDCMPGANILWDTVATNLGEFQKVANELSSSKNGAHVAVVKTIENDAIPVLEKLKKKKDRALKRKQRQEMLLSDSRNSYVVGTTRSCRNRRPVSYTFDEYDRTIDEAIQLAKRKIPEAPRPGRNHDNGQRIDKEPIEEEDMNSDCKGSLDEKDGFMDTDPETESDRHEMASSDNGTDGGNDNGGKENGSDNHEELSDSENEICNSDEKDNATIHPHTQTGHNASLQWSKRVAGLTIHHTVGARSPGAKNRLRQRPIKNSALESAVVPDSDDNSPDDSDGGASGMVEDSASDAEMEEVSDC